MECGQSSEFGKRQDGPELDGTGTLGNKYQKIPIQMGIGKGIALPSTLRFPSFSHSRGVSPAPDRSVR